MTVVWWIAAGGLLANIAVSLAVMMRRGSRIEPLLAVLLFGTAGVALVIVLGEARGTVHGIDVALVLALLAAVFGIAAVRLGWFARPDDAGDRR